MLLTGGYDQLIRVWDYRMMRVLNELAGHTGSVRCLALEDDRLLSGSTDGTVRLWDFPSILAHGRSVVDDRGEMISAMDELTGERALVEYEAHQQDE